MAHEAWTVRTPSDGVGRTALLAGTTIVLLLVVGALLLARTSEEAPPAAPEPAVREASPPRTAVRTDHPTDEAVHKKAFSAPPNPDYSS